MMNDLELDEEEHMEFLEKGLTLTELNKLRLECNEILYSFK